MTWQILFNSPVTYQDNPRVKSWVKMLLEHKPVLEGVVGADLGAVLGCGHFGCVVDMINTPWVLKLTVDPTEAHIWKKITNLIEEERYGEDGFTRVTKIFELEPGIPYGKMGRKKKAYGIVREKIAPLLASGATWVNDWSDYTKQYIAATATTISLEAELKENLRYIEYYRQFAGLSHVKDSVHKLTYRDKAESAAHRMYGGIGGALGESLVMLASNGVYLRDVHLNNIGWRVYPEIDGPGSYAQEGLVVFDPGHTPTEKRALPVERWQQFANLG